MADSDNPTSGQGLRWKRVLLKLSGEAFAAEFGKDAARDGEVRTGLNYATIRSIATEVVAAHSAGRRYAAHSRHYLLRDKAR